MLHTADSRTALCALSVSSLRQRSDSLGEVLGLMMK